MENFLFILVLLFFGMALGRVAAFPETTPLALNQYVIHLSLPALIFVQFPHVTFSFDLLTPILMPWLMLAFSALAVLMFSRWLGWSRSVTGGLLMVVPLGNTSFLGFPMIEALFGPDFIPYALLYDQLGTFPGLTLYGSLILALYSEKGGVSARQIGYRILTFPPFLALVLAAWMASRGGGLDPMILSLLKRVADTLVPVVMVAVGMQLKFKRDRGELQPLLVGLGLKLVGAPLLALAVCTALGLTGEAVTIAIFEAAMPSMITAGAMAMAAGLAPTLVASMVGVGLLVSYVTLPLWHYILLKF